MLCKDIYAECNKWARHHVKILDLMDFIHDVENINFINMLIKTYQTNTSTVSAIACFDGICLSWYRVFVILAFNFPLNLLGRIAWGSQINKIDELS